MVKKVTLMQGGIWGHRLLCTLQWMKLYLPVIGNDVYEYSTNTPHYSLLMSLRMDYGSLVSHRDCLYREHSVRVHCAAPHSLLDFEIGGRCTPTLWALWGPYVMTNAHHCIPQTFHACMNTHTQGGRRRTLPPARDDDSQLLPPWRGRAFAESANLRRPISCLRAVSRLQKEDTTAH